MLLEPASILDFEPKLGPYKVSDGNGLYLLVNPNGSRWWRFRYRWAGKQNTVSCGVYPEVGLAEARARRDAFRAMLVDGIDASQSNKAEKTAQRDEQARQWAATRFTLDNDGALAFRLGNRGLSLTPSETADLRAFLDATREVTPKR
jgi:hypothetical protein